MLRFDNFDGNDVRIIKYVKIRIFSHKRMLRSIRTEQLWFRQRSQHALVCIGSYPMIYFARYNCNIDFPVVEHQLCICSHLAYPKCMWITTRWSESGIRVIGLFRTGRLDLKQSISYRPLLMCLLAQFHLFTSLRCQDASVTVQNLSSSAPFKYTGSSNTVHVTTAISGKICR